MYCPSSGKQTIVLMFEYTLHILGFLEEYLSLLLLSSVATGSKPGVLVARIRNVGELVQV